MSFPFATEDIALLKLVRSPELWANLTILEREILSAEFIGTPKRTIETIGLLSEVSGALRTG